MQRAALYVRVSTKEQKLHGWSVDTQIDSLHKFCKDNGYVEVGIFNDAGLSGHITYKRRPAIQQLIKECQAKNIDIILFTKLDRFFRSVPDYYAFMERTGNIPWKAIEEDYETATSAGQFKVNIMLAVAQAEAERTSERIKVVNAYRKEQGLYTAGQVPVGYSVSKGVISIDEEKKEAVEAFFHDYLNCFNIAHAISVLHEHGVMYGRHVARKLLSNTFYCGDAHGVPCPQYVTQEQFALIQKSLSAKRQKNQTKQNTVYMFTGGVARCGLCHYCFYGSTRKMPSGGKILKYVYYRCPQHQNIACENSRTISETRIEKFLIENLEALVEQYNQSIEALPEDSVNTTAQLESLNKKLERIGVRYEDGDISTAEYRQKRDDIKAQIDALNIIPFKKEKKILPADWLDVYYSLDKEHKKAFWISTIDQVIIYPDGHLEAIL